MTVLRYLTAVLIGIIVVLGLEAVVDSGKTGAIVGIGTAAALLAAAYILAESRRP